MEGEEVDVAWIREAEVLACTAENVDVVGGIAESRRAKEYGSAVWGMSEEVEVAARVMQFDRVGLSAT
eukprot:CAMPEP_0198226226 /NCGR_PEP_ID=MMETSP1445-20131203/104490_1 /TAXON_ID=36898 /ORGANISM="Pyramimonas sp., Strain CCMP2087" /LENGTH=67 /DNA_ID=CAMNT_0043905995 /DNA_START=87 /DNA_END=290 /DNA_ORIENTATION=+